MLPGSMPLLHWVCADSRVGGRLAALRQWRQRATTSGEVAAEVDDGGAASRASRAWANAARVVRDHAEEHQTYRRGVAG